MVSPIYDYLLSLQLGLGSCVVPELRAVTAELNSLIGSQITPYFFYDSEITDKITEQVQQAMEEVDESFPEQIKQVKYPQKIPIRGVLAYLRYEPILPQITKENRSFLLKEGFPPQSVFRLDMQEALLGKVTPELRHVSVAVDPLRKKLFAHLIYDGKISDLNRHLAQTAIQDSRISLPEYEMDSLIEQVDFPSDFTCRGNWLAYWRREREFPGC